MPNNLKGYDFPQVIRSVFDVDKNCLRVCIVDSPSGPGGGIEVIISHTDDSIRLGDGTTLMTGTTVGAKHGQDVYTINSPIGIAGATDTLTMGTSGNQYTYVFPIGTKWFEIHSRNKGTLKFGYSSGNRNMTITPGNVKKVSDLNLTSLTTLYVESSKNNDILEIHYWV